MNATPHLTDEQLSSHLDSQLGAVESAAVSGHLFTCADCTARMERLGATSQAVAALPETPLPRALDMSFLAAPRRASVWTRVFPARPPAWAYAAAGAAAVLVIAVAVVPRTLLNNSSGGSTTAMRQANTAGSGAPTSPVPGAFFESRPQSDQAGNQSVPAVPGAAMAPASHSATKTFPVSGSARLTISTDVPWARAGQSVQIKLVAAGGTRDLQLRGDQFALYVTRAGTEQRLAFMLIGTLKAGSSPYLTTSWLAGSAGGSPAPGDYILLGRLYLADGTDLDVSLTFHVS